MQEPQESFFTIRCRCFGEQKQLPKEAVKKWMEAQWFDCDVIGETTFSFEDNLYQIVSTKIEKEFLEEHCNKVKKSPLIAAIDFPKVYGLLDEGENLKEIIRMYDMQERTFYRRHADFQKNLPQGDPLCRETLVFKEIRPKVQEFRSNYDLDFPSIYDRVDRGDKVKDIAREIDIPLRTLYKRHELYQFTLPPDHKYKRENFSNKKLVNVGRQDYGELLSIGKMEEVYKDLKNGFSLGEVTEKYNISRHLLQKSHECYLAHKDLPFVDLKKISTHKRRTVPKSGTKK